MSLKIFSFLVLVGVFFLGCKDSEKLDSSNFSSGSEVSQSVMAKHDSLDKKSYEGLEHIFQDTSKIQSNGKFLMLVFGKNNCSYCEKLKKDIKKDTDLQKYISQNFSPYYINIDYEKMHHFNFGEGKEKGEANVPTSQLAALYKIYATPTTVFSDKDGRTILVIPGYLPDYKKALEFIVSNSWKKAKDLQERNKLFADYLGAMK